MSAFVLWLALLAGVGAEDREDALASELLVLSESHAGGAVTSLGRSRGGRDLACLVLAAEPDRRADRAVWVVGDALGEGERGAALALELARHWVHSPVPGVDLYVTPRLDPDGELEPDVDVMHNFPSGWRPSHELAGAGAFPLQRPEASGAAEFLRAHPELALVWAPGAAEDERGNLFAFARERFGVVTERGEVDATPRARAARFQRAVEGLPHLVLTSIGSRSLGEGLWAIDLELANAGVVSCRLGEGPARAAATARMEVTGAEVVGAASGAPGDALVPLRLPRDRSSLPLELLEGFGWRRLCLVVQLAPGETSAEVAVEVGALGVGGYSCRVVVGDEPPVD